MIIHKLLYVWFNMDIKSLFAIGIIIILCSGCSHDEPEINPCDNINSKYAESIAPLIQSHCALSGCHNGDSLSVGNFNNYTEVKLRVDNGQFKARVLDSKTMPPLSKPSLTTEEYNKFKCWVDGGALNN